jgi:aconitate hydratase
MIGAGLLAKAVEAGLTVSRTSRPRSRRLRIVTEYRRARPALPRKLGFNLAAYGCTTCIGNAAT